jgi:hypothetical protein
MGPRSGRWARKAPQPTEPQRRVAQSVAEILSKHDVLKVEGIDRVYLNVYVSRLQIVEGVPAFMAAIEKFVQDNAIQVNQAAPG